MSQTIYGNSGVETISGLVQKQPLPVQVFGGISGRIVEAYSGYDGKYGLAVFVIGQSGGASSTNVSGQYMNVASSGVGISHYSGALNINISGGTITSNVSGNYVNIASSGVGLSHYSGALNVNISGAGTLTVSLAGTTISGGVTISGSVQISGTVAVSGQVIITSGGTIPVGILSGASNISGGVTVSGGITVSGSVQVSGTVTVLFNSGIITNLASGLIDSFEYPSYTLISYWSGTAGKGLIGIYHSGGVAGQSGIHVALTKLKVGIFASGNINRIDVIVGSGNISGTAGTVAKFSQADTTSVVVGYIDGATQVSGNVIATVDTVFLEANSSGYLHNYVVEYPEDKLKSVRVRSGEEIWVRMVSGIGIGFISLDWVERYP